MPLLDISSLARSLKTINAGDALKKRIEKRVQRRSKYDVPEFQEIHNQTFRLQTPFTVLLAFVREIGKTFPSFRNIWDKHINHHLGNKADELCVFPENESWRLAQIIEFRNLS